MVAAELRDMLSSSLVTSCVVAIVFDRASTISYPEVLDCAQRAVCVLLSLEKLVEAGLFVTRCFYWCDIPLDVLLCKASSLNSAKHNECAAVLANMPAAMCK